ncbi:MAG TPA: sugar phosphate isomerase/epimerase family protein [Pseudonocardiaceae bacterium]|jgi:sugar phosphate isomerase/epimerase|nr:sugar phosphate isomerase/epimerase family protein [Pseudonocardiaceae bacterium]
MTLLLGVDTLSYHCRLDAGEITVEEVFREAAELGFAFVQINITHVRRRSDTELAALRGLADELGLAVHVAGEQVGYAHQGETPADGVRRILRWAEYASAVGSPYLRVSSGFYRQELTDPALIAAEQRYVIDTLRAAAAELAGTGIRLLLENHSDFTVDEYSRIIDEVGPDSVGVFLDVINPISTLADPLPVVAELVRWAPAGHVKDYRFRSHYVEGGFHRCGFDVRWCYPGEGVADLAALVGAVASGHRSPDYHLSIEGLDNRSGVADQRDRLKSALDTLLSITGTAP